MNIICWLFGHKRGKTKLKKFGIWHIQCSRCGYKAEYHSPHARLVGREINLGFDGK